MQTQKKGGIVTPCSSRAPSRCECLLRTDARCEAPASLADASRIAAGRDDKWKAAHARKNAHAVSIAIEPHPEEGGVVVPEAPAGAEPSCGPRFGNARCDCELARKPYQFCNEGCATGTPRVCTLQSRVTRARDSTSSARHSCLFWRFGFVSSAPGSPIRALCVSPLPELPVRDAALLRTGFCSVPCGDAVLLRKGTCAQSSALMLRC